MALATLLLLAAAQVGVPPMDTLLKELRSDDPDLRTRANVDLLNAWSAWTDADLLKLEEAGLDKDPEVSGRASEIRSRIRIRRTAGEKLIKEIPGIDDAFYRGDDEAKLSVLREARTGWQSGTLPQGSLKGLEALASRAAWRDSSLFDRFLKEPDSRKTFSVAGDAASRALVRAKEVEILGTEGRKRAGQVAEFLSDGAPEVRSTALRVMGGLQAREQAPKIAALLRDRNSGVRGDAAALLGTWEAKEYAADFALLLEDPVLAVRRRASEALVAWGHKDAAPQFVRLLKDSYAPSRADAAAALGMLGAKEFAPHLVLLLEDPQATVRRSAATALGRFGAFEFGSQLKEMLQDRDPEVRWAAAQSLGQLGPCAIVDEVVGLIRDGHPEVRLEAAWVAGHTASGEAVQRIAGLLGDRDADVRQGAVWALGLRKARGSRSAVTTLLADRAEWVRSEAVLALGTMGTAEDAPKIAALLRDPDRKVRVSAALALGALGQGDPQGALAALEKDTDRLLGLAATLSLVRLGKGGAAALRAALKEIASDDLAFACLGTAAMDAASFVLSREAWDLLNRPLALRRPVETWTDLSSALFDAGLGFEVQTDCMIGRLDRTHVLTGRDAVAWLLGRFAAPSVVLDGRKVRLMSGRDALLYWQKALDGK